MTSEQNHQEQPEQQKPVQKHEQIEFDEKGRYKIQSQRQEYQLAEMLLRTRAVPQTFKEPMQVMVAIQALRSLDLNPFTAIRQCSFNAQGAFTIFGDLELAIVRQSGELESIDEFLFVVGEEGKYQRRCFDNSNLHLPAYGAVCRIKMKEMPVHESSFTIDDAKAAGLWQKTPTWRLYPSRMMAMRARGLAIRNTASNHTQGVAGYEYDVDGVEYAK